MPTSQRMCANRLMRVGKCIGASVACMMRAAKQISFRVGAGPMHVYYSLEASGTNKGSPRLGTLVY